MKLLYKYRIAIFIFLALVFSIFIYSFNGTWINESFKYDIMVLDNWSITINGTSYSDADNSDYNIPVATIGDIIILENTIPTLDSISSMVLTYETDLSATELYIDNELVYSYGMDVLEKGDLVPNMFNNYPIDSTYSGKKIKIFIYPSRYNAFSGFNDVKIGNSHELTLSFMQDRRFPLFNGIFLMVFGVILRILSPYLFFFHQKDFRLLTTSYFSSCMGLYILSYNKIFILLSPKTYINTYLEYISLYLIPISILSYLFSLKETRYRKIFGLFFIVDLFFFVIIVILHFLHINNFTSYTQTFHIIAITEGVIAVLLLLYGLLKPKKTENNVDHSEKIFLIGLVIFMCFAMIDIIKFNYSKYYSSGGEANSNINFMIIGTISFVITLVISYFLYTINSTSSELLHSKLSSLAYTDPLTGLANRARCEQVMTALSEDTIPYVIISFDLDYLKKINDTLGHEEGDRLLNGFSTILNDCFWDSTIIGRMGGDEFIVIMTEDNVAMCSRKLQNLRSMISTWNKKEQKFDYSASYGYAYSNETPTGQAKEVYMLADNRMYEMKNDKHAQMLRKEGLL